MERYLAFWGWKYYASGGMEDFIGDFKTVEEANEAIEKERVESGIDDDGPYSYSWSHVYDTEEKRIVVRYGEEIKP